MKIKEKRYVKYDENGKVVARKRCIEIEDCTLDEGYDFATRYCGPGEPKRASLDRIFEAVDDYRRSNEW